MAILFDLDTESGETFPFFRTEILENGEVKCFEPDKDEACRVTLRLASPDVLENIYKKTRTPVIDRTLNTKSRSMERIKDYDQTPEQIKEERVLTWDYAIVGWEGVLDKHKTPVDCTTENKMRMMEIPIFGRFVGQCLGMISGEAQEYEKEKVKNS